MVSTLSAILATEKERIPGCISYRDHSGSFKHTLFFYRIGVDLDPADPTPSIPKVHSVFLVGLEPLN
jgi:hypothetical protein